MQETFVLTNVEGELVATMEQIDAHPEGDIPFRVLLMGDWSGRLNRRLLASSEELTGWRPLPVDRDNLDEVMTRLGVKLDLQLSTDRAQLLTINFNRLGDFHPDALFGQLEIFEQLQQIRTRLSNPQTFAEAAREMRGSTTVSQLATSQPELVKKQSSEAKPEAPPPGGSLLDQILKGASTESSPTASVPLTQSVSPEISRLARAAVDAYSSPNIEPDQDQLIAALDARIAADMNAILHHEDFKTLEAAWRALDFLTKRLETSSQLKLYLLDISFEELKVDLRSNKDIRSTMIFKLLVEQSVGTGGGLPWAVIAANYTFDFGGGDSALIERISLLAKEANAPFIAATTSHLLGCESLVETPDPDDWRQRLDAAIEEWWKSVRSIPTSAYVGFALPRFLLRLPYGKETEPVEQFDLEEMPENERGSDGDDSSHQSYLWANPAFAVAYLLAKGFSENGWNFRPSDFQEIEGLPLHVYKREGELEIKPCAEVLLTLRAAEKIIDQGLMPLLSMKDTDTVKLGMFQSIAGTRLKGRWIED